MVILTPCRPPAMALRKVSNRVQVCDVCGEQLTADKGYMCACIRNCPPDIDCDENYMEALRCQNED